ncbi:MAG: hypothetical protein ACJASQ_000092 [Crocinitomicaceae bacterium]|jgi:hypothetical protein
MHFFFSSILLFSLGFSVINNASAQITTSSSSGSPSYLNASKTVLHLSQSRTVYDNRVDLDFDANENPVIIYGVENEGSYIRALDKNWEFNSTEIELKGIYFMDFLVIDSDYYVLGKETAGYTGAGQLDYEEEGNILVFLKVDTTGRIIYKHQLFGHEGTKGGQYFLCTYSSHGELAFDGNYFHAMVETCGNFTAQGSSEFDIHEGDYYLTFDIDGIVRENGRSPWNHSHSYFPHTISDGTGEGVAISIGDASPFGISFTRFSDGKKVSDRVIHPDQNILSYEEMHAISKSTTDAGEIGGIVRIGDYFYTVIATVPKQNLPILKQKKDFLFIKMDLNGKEVMRRWIKTPNQDESIPFIIELNGDIFMAFMYKTGEFEYDYTATVALLNTNGDYLITPKKTDYTLNYQSRLTQFPNGDPALISIEPYGHEAEFIRFESTKIPAPAPIYKKKPVKIILKGSRTNIKN